MIGFYFVAEKLLFSIFKVVRAKEALIVLDGEELNRLDDIIESFFVEKNILNSRDIIVCFDSSLQISEETTEILSLYGISEYAIINSVK